MGILMLIARLSMGLLWSPALSKHIREVSLNPMVTGTATAAISREAEAFRSPNA